MKLNDELKNLDRYPYHMPGHKRNAKFGIIASEIDITEIEGFDNLHSPDGIIKEVEQGLSDIYKAKKSFISVNGSTAGILASIFAVCKQGDEVIIARNCHKSVFNACMILKLKITYIEPEFDYTNGYYTRITQETVNNALRKNKKAKALIITSPTYEGYISDIESDIPLIVDSAHGAHLGISYFPKYAKGDIVISSLHKTLPALTQCAVVNVYSEKYIDKVKDYMDIFQSTSPSYVLMNSIAKCVDYVKTNKRDFGLFYENLCDLRLASTKNLRIKFNDDISKIVLSTANTNINGSDLSDILRKKYHIEPEMVSANYVLLMTTVGDEKENLQKLKNIIEEIDEGLIERYEKLMPKPDIPTGRQVIIKYDEYEECPLDNSAGKISNEFVYAYPPDIPLTAPNERITRETVDYIKLCIENGVNIISDSGKAPNYILTKKEN